MTSRVVLAFALVMAAFGIQGLWRLAQFWYEGRSSRQWPTVDGEIVHAESRWRPNVHRVTLQYRYVVKGATHLGHRVGVSWDWDRDFWMRSAAEGIVDRYPPGCRVVVYYDPEQPQQAVLEAGREGRLLVKCLLQVAYTAFAVWLALAMVK